MQDEPDNGQDFSAIGSQAAPPTWLERKKAEKEQDALEDPKKAAHDEVYRLTVRALRFGAWMLAALVAIRLWHLAGPYSMFGFELRWLTEADIQSMDKMLFSSALGGLVLGHLKEIMKPIDKK